MFSVALRTRSLQEFIRRQYFVQLLAPVSDSIASHCSWTLVSVGPATVYFYAMFSCSLPISGPPFWTVNSTLTILSRPIRHFYHRRDKNGGWVTVCTDLGVRVWSFFDTIWPPETTTSTPAQTTVYSPSECLWEFQGVLSSVFYLCCNCLARP